MGVYIYQSGTETELKNAYIGEYYEWTPNASRTLLYLPLESNATDYSGNNLSTTPSNVTYASLGGVMCVNANGSSSKIQITDTSFLTSSQTEGTISFLVYGTSRAYNSTYRNIISFCSSAAGIFGQYRSSLNGIATSSFDGIYVSDSDATLNTWHLFTEAFDTNICSYYLDGQLVGTGNRNSTSSSIWGKTPDVTGFYIFCNRGGNNNRWSGGGRELIFESVKRSAEDVSKYYQRIKNKLGF